MCVSGNTPDLMELVAGDGCCCRNTVFCIVRTHSTCATLCHRRREYEIRSMVII